MPTKKHREKPTPSINNLVYSQDCAALAEVHVSTKERKRFGFLCVSFYSVLSNSVFLSLRNLPLCAHNAFCFSVCINTILKKAINQQVLPPLLCSFKIVMNSESSGSADNHTNSVSFFSSAFRNPKNTPGALPSLQ